MLNFEKQRHVPDAECHQESNGAICFFFSSLTRNIKNRVWLYDVTFKRNIVEINLVFYQKFIHRFEILHCGGCRLFA